MAAPTNSGESDMAIEDFCLSLSPLLSPRWSPPRPFLPSSSSMVMKYQGSNQSMDNPLQNQEHDDIVDPAPYLAGDSALLQQQRQKLRQNWIEASDWRPRGGIMTMNNQGFEESNMGFEEESEEMMMMNCFYFPPSSPTDFPLYRPKPSVFFVSSEQENISLALSSQHILEDKTGALHVISGVDKVCGGQETLRVKVYRLRDDGKWDDRGTGHFTVDYLERSEELGLFVVDEEDNETLLVLRISSDDIYRKQEDTIISWRDPDYSTELALSFQEPTGCSYVWDQIGCIQRNLNFNTLSFSIAKRKSSCQEYGIHKWPPRNEHKFIRQSLPNETPTVVGQEGIPQLSSHTVPSTQALTATVDTNSFFEKEILPPQFLPIAQQENPDADLGNDEDDAIGMGVEATGDGVMVEAQLNSGCSGKGKFKEKSPGGGRGNKGTTGVRIAIAKEDVLQTKGMRLKDAAKHLQVSRSTLKRTCREYGIKRWPPRKEHELISQTRPNESLAIENELISQTHPNESLVVDVDQEQTPQLNPGTFLPSNQVSTTIDTKSVKLKARYEGSTITFRLSRPLRKVELEQEVKKRLQLEAETYNISYKDEDDDLVLIACDDDLEECISSSTPLGSRCHELFLKPK